MLKVTETADLRPEATRAIFVPTPGLEVLGETATVGSSKDTSQGPVTKERSGAGATPLRYKLSELCRDYDLFVLGGWYILHEVPFDVYPDFVQRYPEAKIPLKDLKVCTLEEPLLLLEGNNPTQVQARSTWSRIVHCVPKPYSLLFEKYLLQATVIRKVGPVHVYGTTHIHILYTGTPGVVDTPVPLHVAAPVCVFVPSLHSAEFAPGVVKQSGIIAYAVRPCPDEQVVQETVRYFTACGDIRK